jgi:hypothetical protein
MRVPGFVRTVLIANIGRMVHDCRLYYLSFGVIAQGIEFLGACLDEEPFDAKRMSRKRFNAAIESLFPETYGEYIAANSEFCLYEELRCSLVHSVRPGRKASLTHREEARREGTEHLGVFDGKLVVVVEDLYDDLRLACEEVIRRAKIGQLPYNKGELIYIEVD